MTKGSRLSSGSRAVNLWGFVLGSLFVLLFCETVVHAEVPVKPAARDLWKQAMDFHRAKDSARAMDVFLKAYGMDPAVLSLESEGLLDSGIRYLKSRLEEKKDDVAFTYKLAELCNLRGNLAEAIRHYKAVVRLAPHSSMGQVAADEARKLEGFLTAAAPPPETSSAPSASPSSSAAAKEKELRSQESENKVKELEEALKKQKEDYGQLKEEMDKLKEEYAKLQEEYNKANYYKTLYFANPANIQLLQQRRIK